MHALPVAVQPTARQQLWVPNMLLVARLFQALPRLTELKLAAPAAVVFAAIRFWCAACSETQSTLCQHVCSHGDRAHQIKGLQLQRFCRCSMQYWPGSTPAGEVKRMRYLSMRFRRVLRSAGMLPAAGCATSVDMASCHTCVVLSLF